MTCKQNLVLMLILLMFLSIFVNSTLKRKEKLAKNNKNTNKQNMINNTARYIKLQMANKAGHYLNLSQLSCYSIGGRVVTQGKPIIASDKYRKKLRPETLVDGKLKIRKYPHIFHSKSDKSAWVEIDLQMAINISSCYIHNRKDCCKNRIKGAVVYLLDDKKKEVNKRTITGESNIEVVRFDKEE